MGETLVRRGDHNSWLVTEGHSNVARAGSDLYRHCADILDVLAHELSEPMTAISAYVNGAQQFSSRDGRIWRAPASRWRGRPIRSREAESGCACRGSWPPPCAKMNEPAASQCRLADTAVMRWFGVRSRSEQNRGLSCCR